MESKDGGKTWSKPHRLPEGILGPIRVKPLELSDGRVLSGSSTEHAGWRVHVEWSGDLGQTWQKSEPLNDGEQFAAIQPTILDWPGPKIQLLCRSRQKVVTQLWSDDGGKTWGSMEPTELPNPSAGIDALLLRDGRALLIYNHTPQGRSPLNLAVSKDGQTWQQVLALETEPGEFSYPALIQAKDGLVHATYTWKRKRIRHVALDPAKL
jgi:predicted neuraminidase